MLDVCSAPRGTKKLCCCFLSVLEMLIKVLLKHLLFGCPYQSVASLRSAWWERGCSVASGTVSMRVMFWSWVSWFRVAHEATFAVEFELSSVEKNFKTISEITIAEKVVISFRAFDGQGLHQKINHGMIRDYNENWQSHQDKRSQSDSDEPSK